MGILLTGKFNPSAGAQAFKLYDSFDIDYPVASKSTTYAATTADGIVLCNGTFTVTLYTAVGRTGNPVTIKNIGTGTITVDTTSSQTIDGSLTITLPVQYTSVTLVSDGSNWNVT